MTLTSKDTDCVDPGNLDPGLDGRLKEIKRLRTRQDSDFTWIAYSLWKSWKRDHVFVQSKDLLGIYVERPTKVQFGQAIRQLRKKLHVKDELLGDQDGILYFPWKDLPKLKQFHKQRKGSTFCPKRI